MTHSILTPAAVLIIWSIIVLFWMAASRYKGFMAPNSKVKNYKPGMRGQDLNGMLPDRVMWKSHNYSHLMEQPTLFYAAVLILHITAGVTQTTIILAWAYIICRICHSLWQGLVNTIPVRGALFIISTLCLLVLSIMALLSTLN